MCDFHIRIEGDDLIFCAAHFLASADGTCEPLHGHTYRASVEISGPLDENQCVVDFVAVRAAMKAVVAELDHRVLLPSQHASLRIASQDGVLEVAAADRRWTFPAGDCLLMPLADTTTELLAQYIGRRLQERLARPQQAKSPSLQVTVDEGAGASAVCMLR